MPKLTFPKRHKHRDVRSREHLTPPEVDKLRKAARRIGRHGERNDTMILLAYRHGLRVAELIHLRWDQVDLDQGLLHVRRVKNGGSPARTRSPAQKCAPYANSNAWRETQPMCFSPSVKGH